MDFFDWLQEFEEALGEANHGDKGGDAKEDTVKEK